MALPIYLESIVKASYLHVLMTLEHTCSLCRSLRQKAISCTHNSLRYVLLCWLSFIVVYDE
jgi:hypothetical protein